MRMLVSRYVFIALSACFLGLAGWLSGSFFLGEIKEKSEISNAASSGADIPHIIDTAMLSGEQTFAELYCSNADIVSFEDILKMESNMLRDIALEKYLESLPTEDIPHLLAILIKKDHYLKRVLIPRMLDEWMTRDFESAKNQVIDYLRKEYEVFFSVLNYESSSAIYLGDNNHYKMYAASLFENWIKVNREEAIAFIENEKNAELCYRLIFYLQNTDPKRAFVLYRQCNEENIFKNNFAYFYRYEYLFEKWAKHNVSEALIAADTIEEKDRQGVYSKIIKVLVDSDAEQALALARKHAPEEISMVFGLYAKNNMDGAMVWLRQNDFSKEEREAAIHGIIASIEPKQIKDLLNDDLFDFTKEERRIVREIVLGRIELSDIPGLLEDASYSLSEKEIQILGYNTFSSYSHLENAEEEYAVRKELFSRLSDADKAYILKYRVQNGENARSLLSLCKEIDFEIPYDTEISIIREFSNYSVKEALDYFLTTFSERSIPEEKAVQPKRFGRWDHVNEKESLFENIFSRYLASNREEAISLLPDIKDESIRMRGEREVRISYALKDINAAIAYLNSEEDKGCAITVLERINEEFVLKEPEKLIALLPMLEDKNLSYAGTRSAMNQLWSTSEDAAWDFVDSLGAFPEMQKSAMFILVENVCKRNPRQALDICAVLRRESDRKEDDNGYMNEVFQEYKKRNPEEAAAWAIRNNDVFEQKE